MQGRTRLGDVLHLDDPCQQLTADRLVVEVHEAALALVPRRGVEDAGGSHDERLARVDRVEQHEVFGAAPPRRVLAVPLRPALGAVGDHVVRRRGGVVRPRGVEDVLDRGGDPSGARDLRRRDRRAGAGLAAAVYAGSEGLRTVVVESQTVGGQAGASAKIRNYLGFLGV